MVDSQLDLGRPCQTSAKTRVELNYPSPSLEKKGGKVSSNSYILENGMFDRMGMEVSVFIIITTGKHAGSVLVYRHVPVGIRKYSFLVK